MKAAIERRMEILEVITRQGKARVEDLAERFNVSSVTIRSDLSFLEKKWIHRQIAWFSYPECWRNC
ncbi:DeoR family transcriptional regulator [Salmonella enterica subsp. arizonae]|uniref:DeoR family transcriptional regulator n=1 Tax=Salmonella enterica subsp. arizonae TaxID=59203 RepID=A0A379TA89_SALER|nr:DeoR family transcriptional regulator [Salmonella enterica subsp. arizonae]